MNDADDVSTLESSAAPGPGRANLSRAADHWDLRLSGDVSFEMDEMLDAVLERVRSGHGPVEVDLDAVRFLDSIGLRFLARLAADSAGRVTVHHARGLARATLLVSGMHRGVLTLADDETPTVG